LDVKETKSFSVARLLLARAEPNNRAAQEAAAFELEASAAAVDAHVKAGAEAPRGVVLPSEVMSSSFMGELVGLRDSRQLPAHLQNMARLLSAGTSTDGAELVATDLLAGSFIDVLRNASMVMAAGATTLPDLTGNVAIPRKTSGSAGGWIATEGGDGAESEPQFDQVTLAPKNVVAWMEYTRQLLQQSTPSIEAILRMDIAMGLATTIDLACLYGSGASGQPTGITLTTGINAPTAFAAAVPTYAEVVAMETAVAVDNALVGNLSYMMRAEMKGALKSTEKASGTAQFVWEPGNTVNGYAAGITQQVTSGDIFFGNWPDLLIGMWGGLDLLVDPYSNSKSGKIRLSAFQTVDLAVRHPVSFCFNNDT
jgi:HK97 family phage major capsid protein